MLSISRACTAEDFTIGSELCKAFGAWDAEACLDYGIPSEVVIAFFHGEGDEALAAKYSPDDAPFLLARWHGEPAGCIALEPFDDIAAEIHKFYVASSFRGRGIGRALMQAILAEAIKGQKSMLLVHTTIYMRSAVTLYEAFGFARCRPFRDIPDAIRHTEVFMKRPIRAAHDDCR
ncbi:GNAT superfamily N-acetyltransferase [Rhizobium mesoamericanum]|uniref:GNAT family N-acetyltransferase n=1 Tax=Rhizobium mesoamericanum TaxID=1079800 RepID=UPI0027845BF3|nr:GNAT family N-acetyltransferase [Rhizobium mesoamericanum]MDQ0563277.1 GNAT superfamily N-acetyltransferase [Rhizobium mesoamericanum]